MKPLPRGVALTLFALVGGACLVVGCAQILGIDDLPDRCDDNAACQTPEHPDWMCNLTSHACEAPSAGNECEDEGDCRADAPICGQNNTCRGCADSTECDGAVPICGASGQCVRSCSAAEQCSDAMPYCNIQSGICEACQAPRDNALCNERDDSKPLCGPAGACVACLDNTQCTATAETPICGDDNACRACQEHGECGSNACDRVTGACVAESAVAYVVSGGAGDCTKAAPCGTIADALEFVRANNDARYIVRLDDGTYTEQVPLSDIRVRIIGDGATVQLDSATPNTAVINVIANADVTLEGLTIRGASGGASARGLRCSGDETSTVQLLQSIVTENAAVGIDVTLCSLTVSRSAITKNVGGGIQVTTSAFDITNTYILDNGDVRDSVVAGVRIANGQAFSPQRFAFNTVADNEGSAGADAGGVFCDINASSTAITTSNVIMEGFGGRPAVGGDCTWVYSNIEDKADIPGAIAADETNIDANCMLTDRPDGLQAIDAASSCVNAGQDDTGILVDYDGAARPATDPDMGADEL